MTIRDTGKRWRDGQGHRQSLQTKALTQCFPEHHRQQHRPTTPAHNGIAPSSVFTGRDALTQQRRAELRVNAPILSESPEHQPVSPVQLGQADVSLHHLHLPVRVEKIPAAGPDHDEHRDPHALLHHLQEAWRGQREVGRRGKREKVG